MTNNHLSPLLEFLITTVTNIDVLSRVYKDVNDEGKELGERTLMIYFLRLYRKSFGLRSGSMTLPISDLTYKQNMSLKCSMYCVFSL